MKRITVLLVTLLVLFSFANAYSESLFQNVSWLADEATVLEYLAENGYLRNGISTVNFSDTNPVYLIENDAGFATPDKIMDAEDVTFVMDLSGLVEGRLAGYPIKDLILTFAYDGSYKLISIRIELVKAGYEDIKNKITKVYGDGNWKKTDEGIDSILWEGENNSAILLYTETEGLDYTFIYGRLDAADILFKCLATPDPDDVSGL